MYYIFVWYLSFRHLIFHTNTNTTANSHHQCSHTSSFPIPDPHPLPATLTGTLQISVTVVYISFPVVLWFYTYTPLPHYNITEVLTPDLHYFPFSSSILHWFLSFFVFHSLEDPGVKNDLGIILYYVSSYSTDKWETSCVCQAKSYSRVIEVKTST